MAGILSYSIAPEDLDVAIGTVILVPGITGSSLSYAFSPLGLGQVWCRPDMLLAGGFPAMRLLVGGEPRLPPAPAVNSPGGPLLYYYGPLMTYLQLRGWRVAAPVADWRKPMSLDAGALAALIRREGANGPVKLLCHSRGGLVARTALGYLAYTGEASLVDRVVGMGVPHTGSLAAAAYVSGDSHEVDLVRDLASIFPGGLVSSYAVRTITDVTRTWPALHELMPAPGNGWFDEAQTAALYVPSSWAASATVVVPLYLSNALSNWTAVPPVPGSLDWIDVAGVGSATPSTIKDMEELARDGTTYSGLDGDGTVPLASAAQSPRRRVTVPTSHASLPIDPRIWELCHELLSNGLSADIAITGRLLAV